MLELGSKIGGLSVYEETRSGPLLLLSSIHAGSEPTRPVLRRDILLEGHAQTDISCISTDLIPGWTEHKIFWQAASMLSNHLQDMPASRDISSAVLVLIYVLLVSQEATVIECLEPGLSRQLCQTEAAQVCHTIASPAEICQE
ncbi:hypothetical protein ElyMa_002929600 [Elysia marginata]|uniref:Uncharacterized protein n=1 Tax=Elysia marginata TaxID=1093978 RepID=A0AAV4I800_9GAST|nr:hypothetical protein ElyMa_002929600 [Elysia marginata]